MSRIHQLSKKNAFKARVSTFRELLEIEQSWPVHGWASPNTPRYDVMRSIFCHQHIFAGATQVDSWVALKNLFWGIFVAECGTQVMRSILRCCFSPGAPALTRCDSADDRMIFSRMMRSKRSLPNTKSLFDLLVMLESLFFCIHLLLFILSETIHDYPYSHHPLPRQRWETWKPCGGRWHAFNRPNHSPILITLVMGHLRDMNGMKAMKIDCMFHFAHRIWMSFFLSHFVSFCYVLHCFTCFCCQSHGGERMYICREMCHVPPSFHWVPRRHQWI